MLIAGGAVVVAVVVAGLAGALVWWNLHQTQEADMVATHSGGGSIALDTSGTQGSQGMNLGGGTTGGTSGGGSGGGSVKGVTDLDKTAASDNVAGPTRAELAGYDKYKNASQVMYGDIVTGSGAEVKAGSKVVMNYRLWLTNGTLADDSYARGQAFAFTEGEHRVISGIEAGILGMRSGGKRRIVVPPAGGYGDKAQGPIPANSVLVFDVEVGQAQ